MSSKTIQVLHVTVLGVKFVMHNDSFVFSTIVSHNMNISVIVVIIAFVITIVQRCCLRILSCATIVGHS